MDSLIVPLESLNFNSGMQKARMGLISLALIQANGNRCHAAKVLGVHRNTLSRQMHDLGLHHWPRDSKKLGENHVN